MFFQDKKIFIKNVKVTEIILKLYLKNLKYKHEENKYIYSYWNELYSNPITYFDWSGWYDFGHNSKSMVSKL